MADITVTAANVVASAAAVINRSYNAGATITAGQAVYLDSATSTWKLADANASATTADVVGIALNGASSGQPLAVATEDADFTPGATLSLSAAAGATFISLSGTAGGICPIADNKASGMYPVILGIAKSTSKMVLKVVKGGAVQTA